MYEELARLARQAANIILNRPDFKIDEKQGHANFVTSIDTAVQALLQKELARILPEARFIGEESENEALTDALTWIIDPVDGTTNLIHDYKQSAVSIALLKNKQPVAGLIYKLYDDEMFYAEAGKGAYLNGQPIHVSETPFEKALVAFGSAPYNSELAKISLDTAYQFLINCADIRRSGSAAIDLVNLACGRTDIFFEMILSPWDFAAGALIVKEAGGVLDMPLSDKGWDFTKKQRIFASNVPCYKKARALFDDAVRKGEQA